MTTTSATADGPTSPDRAPTKTQVEKTGQTGGSPRHHGEDRIRIGFTHPRTLRSWIEVQLPSTATKA